MTSETRVRPSSGARSSKGVEQQGAGREGRERLVVGDLEQVKRGAGAQRELGRDGAPVELELDDGRHEPRRARAQQRAVEAEGRRVVRDRGARAAGLPARRLERDEAFERRLEVGAVAGPVAGRVAGSVPGRVVRTAPPRRCDPHRCGGARRVAQPGAQPAQVPPELARYRERVALELEAGSVAREPQRPAACVQGTVRDVGARAHGAHERGILGHGGGAPRRHGSGLPRGRAERRVDGVEQRRAGRARGDVDVRERQVVVGGAASLSTAAASGTGARGT